MLEHLRGEIDPVVLLQSVPGIGKIQAERLHHDLGIDTLEELEAAAHDGRLASVAGLGSKKIAGIVDSLASRLGRLRQPQGDPAWQVPVEELLDIDREYREAAQAGTLPTIAPRRFNPEKEAWLPILHTQRDDRHYTAMFSNTARAHRLGTTHDWVILLPGWRFRRAPVHRHHQPSGSAPRPANRSRPRSGVPGVFRAPAAMIPRELRLVTQRIVRSVQGKHVTPDRPEGVTPEPSSLSR